VSGHWVDLSSRTPEPLQTFSRINPQRPLYRGTRDIGQLGNPLVRLAETLEPEDFHSLLDTRMRVVITLTSNYFDYVCGNEYVGRIRALPNFGQQKIENRSSSFDPR
jgi:hypothetical protein